MKAQHRTTRYAIFAAAALRLLLIAIAGNRLIVPWGSDNDSHVYADLAQHVIDSQGYSFGGVPSALRPPLYPLIVAFFLRMAGPHWIIALRLFQATLSLATAWLCGALAEKWFGPRAQSVALVIALFLPTLLYFVPEILTETCAAFLVISILYVERPELAGVLTGVLLLTRLNAAPLALIMGWKLRQRILAYSFASALVLLPWCLRNLVVFHGRVLLSTNSGLSLVQGLLDPDGRAHTPATKNILGWESNDLETDRPHPGMRDEVALNRRATALATTLWRGKGFSLIPLLIRKLGYFWLGTDQFSMGVEFPWRKKLIRWVGLAVYWAVLVTALLGLCKLEPGLRNWLIVYAILLTAFHLPVIMASRYRVPLFDPLLAVLAGSLPVLVCGHEV
jgi:hypothetical protein